MLIIRFSRVGKRNHAQYKIVLAEKTYPVKGKFVELLGSYDPHLKRSTIKQDRVEYWLSQGVSCSDSAYNLLVTEGVIKADKRQVKIPQKKKDASEDTTEAEKKAEPKENEKATGAEEIAEPVKDEPKQQAVQEKDKIEDEKGEVKPANESAEQAQAEEKIEDQAGKNKESAKDEKNTELEKQGTEAPKQAEMKATEAKGRQEDKPTETEKQKG